MSTIDLKQLFIDENRLKCLNDINNKHHDNFYSKLESRINNVIITDKALKIIDDYDIENIYSLNNFKRCIDWDFQNGELIWKACPNLFSRKINFWNTKYIGQKAFNTEAGNKYLYGKFIDNYYKAHRMLWYLEYGEWPEQIDHINGIRNDNRGINLRNVTIQQNAKNKKLNINNKSGYSGVCWNKKNKSWQVTIGSGHNKIHVGHFKNLECAINARKESEINCNYHHNHGRV